jgi:choline dehydrogenase-like flavoprotein
MGGLRMGTDVRRSVVDRDLEVHGLENLHVASCAIFPSGSSSNPTFTMMALTLRLADHLARQIAKQGTVSYSSEN